MEGMKLVGLGSAKLTGLVRTGSAGTSPTASGAPTFKKQSGSPARGQSSGLRRSGSQENVEDRFAGATRTDSFEERQRSGGFGVGRGGRIPSYGSIPGGGGNTGGGPGWEGAGTAGEGTAGGLSGMAARKRAFRFRRGAALLCFLAVIVATFVLLQNSRQQQQQHHQQQQLQPEGAYYAGGSSQLPQSQQLPQQMQMQDQHLVEQLAGAHGDGGRDGSNPRSGWELAKQGFLLGGRGVLQAVGLGGIISSEEQQKVAASLKQSGDEDHEMPTEQYLTPKQQQLRERMKGQRSAVDAADAEAAAAAAAAAGGLNMTALAAAGSGANGADRIPLADLAARGMFDGRLLIGDGSCPAAPKQQAEDGTVFGGGDGCLPHGACVASQCVCVTTYAPPDCHTARHATTFQGVKYSFQGKFALSVSHVRRMHGVKYLLPLPQQQQQGSSSSISGTRQRELEEVAAALGGKSGMGRFEAPFEKSGKINRVVWGLLQKGRLADLDPILSLALLDLLPGSDPLQNAVFQTCAVVGNSGFNRLFYLGKSIDAHDMVVRILDGPTEGLGAKDPRQGARREGRRNRGFEPGNWRRHVGSRTTFRVVDESLIGWSEGPAEVRLMPVYSKAGFFGHFQYLNKEPDARAFLFDTDFANYVANSIGSPPTPLALALLLAVQKCASVDVYGLHWHPGFGVPPIYYADDGTRAQGAADDEDRDGVHELVPGEQQLVQALAAAGLINVQQPCAAGCEAEGAPPCTNCVPGSACACGAHYRVPVALPEFCQMPGNYSCFYECIGPWRKKCKGGPEGSICPEGLDIRRGCAKPHRVKVSVDHWWSAAGGMAEWDRNWEQSHSHLPRWTATRLGVKRRGRRGGRMRNQ